MRLVWPLVPAAMSVFVLWAITTAVWTWSLRRVYGWQRAWDRLLSDRWFSRSGKWLVFGVFGYVLANGLWAGLIGLGQGSPDEQDGQYVASSHGKVVRTVSEQEYWQLHAYEVRLATGICLMFSLLAVVWLRELPERYRRASEAETAEPGTG
jgi:hypothetical protein